MPSPSAASPPERQPVYEGPGPGLPPLRGFQPAAGVQVAARQQGERARGQRWHFFIYLEKKKKRKMHFVAIATEFPRRD